MDDEWCPGSGREFTTQVIGVGCCGAEIRTEINGCGGLLSQPHSAASASVRVDAVLVGLLNRATELLVRGGRGGGDGRADFVTAASTYGLAVGV